MRPRSLLSLPVISATPGGATGGAAGRGRRGRWRRRPEVRSESAKVNIGRDLEAFDSAQWPAGIVRIGSAPRDGGKEVEGKEREVRGEHVRILCLGDDLALCMERAISGTARYRGDRRTSAVVAGYCK